MITLIAGLPDHVVGLLADKQITREDYMQTVTPAIKAALQKHEKVSLYYELTPGFTGVDIGAGFQDFIIGITHLLKWRRIAIVTDVDWVKKSADFFGYMIPAEVHTYPLAEREIARGWVVG